MDGPIYGDRSEEWWIDTLYNFYTTMDQDEEPINRLMNAVWEHADAMAEYQDLTGNWQDMDYVTKGVDIDVSIHPGAEQFYEEQDVDI
ncbi:hypothetical protein EL22_28370 [Halostagnicola sp. A56]|nr:hypothetical protein EL22_28370 [Halostagnicola sp. A56]